jgi:hypothetical protein
MKSLKEMWRDLAGLQSKVTKLEGKVDAFNRRPPAKGRETPFFGKQQFLFDPFTTQAVEGTLVHDAGRVTRVVRLTYSVYFLTTEDVGGVSGSSTPLPMRATPRGMFILTGNGGAGFEFEWSFKIGSTDRKYSVGQNGWLARRSLGNPEVGSCLLFTPRYPLVLDTDQFLNFLVRPTWWSRGGFGAQGNGDERIAVNIEYAAYRTFGYEDD